LRALVLFRRASDSHGEAAALIARAELAVAAVNARVASHTRDNDLMSLSEALKSAPEAKLHSDAALPSASLTNAPNVGITSQHGLETNLSQFERPTNDFNGAIKAPQIMSVAQAQAADLRQAETDVQAALAIQACIAERAQHAKDAKASEGGKPKAPAKAKCKAKAKPKAKPTPTKASPAKPSSKRVHSVSESRQLFTEGQAKLGDAWVASKLRADLIASMPETEKKRRRLPPYNKK
jgi:hypothetical protein